MTLQDVLDKMVEDDHVSIYNDVKCVCYHVHVHDIMHDLYYQQYLQDSVICIFGLVAGTIGISIRRGEQNEADSWIDKAYDVAIKTLEQPEQRWIPCSEETGDGYPEKDGFYYVTEQNYGFYLDADCKQIVAHTSYFKNGNFTSRYYTENNSNITAWMPLPEPYKGEGEADG